MSLLLRTEVRLSQRRFVSLLVGALLASGCKDPSPTTGSLVLSVNGLPSATNASVRITGPNSYFQRLLVTTTLEKLEPGDYVVRTDTILVLGTRYGADSAAVVDTIAIAKGRTESKAVSYQLASGSLTFIINGLPVGAAANLRLIGPLPGTTSQTVSSAGTINTLRPGQYAVQADTMLSIEGDRFAAAKIRDTVQVTASLTPAQAVVDYTQISGTLALTVNGVPSSVTTPHVTVTGPGGFEYRTLQSVMLRGLSAGTYTITAANFAGACPTTYTATPSQQTKDVSIGATTPASVTYVEGQSSPADLNLRIDGVHLTQASQTYAGTVPMLSGKDAYLRVFGVANQCNTSQANVRVTVSGAAQPFVIAANEQSVRTSPDQGTLASSWNVLIPGALVQPGMTVVAEIDHDNTIAEADETDNRFPATGARTIEVAVAPVVGLRLVPVTQSANNLTGNISAANVDAFMEWSRKLHPVGTYDVDIRAPYTTSVTLTSNGSEGWTTVLGEIRSLRTSDPSNRYYYGVVRVNYTAGIAGIAFVGGPSRTGIGWDNTGASSSGAFVMAHELGHSFGRRHSHCGNPSSPDPNYPTTGGYAGGRIGVYGFDIATLTLKSPDVFTDVMGYCRDQWISDYMYVGMLNYLINNPTSLPMVASNAEQPSLLIWGRIENGRPVLEPAFEISARPELPSRPGPHRLTALDEAGTELLSLSFAGQQIADLPGEHESFAFAVPLSALRGRPLASLRLDARGKTARSVVSSDVAADPRAVVSRAGPRAARVQWDASRFPVVMVRDPVRGHVLSFARGGDATIVTDAAELELNFSNRVRSTRRLSRVLK